MIPTARATGKPKRADGTDCCELRCDSCSAYTYVSAAAQTPEEIRRLAALHGWQYLQGKDHCPYHRACKVCGCTNTNACLAPAGPCRWVEPDLCSACRPEVP